MRRVTKATMMTRNVKTTRRMRIRKVGRDVVKSGVTGVSMSKTPTTSTVTEPSTKNNERRSTAPTLASSEATMMMMTLSFLVSPRERWKFGAVVSR